MDVNATLLDAPPRWRRDGMDGLLRDHLAQFRGEEVLYVPNPGNAGDSLIAAATYQCLGDAGLRWRVPRAVSFAPQGRVVLYGGGGNLVGQGTQSARILARIHQAARHVTILPQTVREVDGLLDAFGPNVTVICREPVSYDYVRARGGRHRTLLMDDVALSLDVARLMAGRVDRLKAARDFVTMKLLRRGGHATFANLRRALFPGPVARDLLARPEGGVLHAFRRDGEATGIAIPPGNVDLSTVFEFGVAPAELAAHAARSLLRALSRFEEVHTNRLHVGIAAALLGRRVRFHANNYYKVRAVYEFSMRARFPNVTWMG